MTAIILIAAFTAASFYILLYRLMPETWMRKVLLSKFGRFILDALAFGCTTLFMIELAGASMFSMAVGATAGVLLSVAINVHAFIVKHSITTPQEFAVKAGRAVKDSFTPQTAEKPKRVPPTIPAEGASAPVVPLGSPLGNPLPV